MFKPVSLSKVIIAGEKSSMDETIKVLHEMKVLHIKSFVDEDEDFEMGRTFPNAPELSKRLLRLRTIKEDLELEKLEEKKEKFSRAEVENRIDSLLAEIEPEVAKLLKLKKEVEQEIEQTKKDLSTSEPFANVDPDIRLDIESLICIAGYIEEPLAEKLAPLGDRVLLFEKVSQGRHAFILFYSQHTEEELFRILDQCRYETITLPEFGGHLGEYVKSLQEKLGELTTLLSDIEANLADIKGEYDYALMATEEYLSNELQKSEAPLNFATTENFFIIEGWFISKTVKDVKKHILEKTDKRVTLYEVDEDVDDNTPIIMDNAEVMKPFEVFIKSYAVPKYKEWDPTALFAIFFPVFFGFMLGDVGYGFVLLTMVLTGVMGRLFKMLGMEAMAKTLNRVIIYSSISSILFGLLYGEFFGFEMFTSPEATGIFFPHIHFNEYYITTLPLGIKLTAPIHRFNDFAIMIILSVLIGMFHQYIAWMVGLRNTVVLKGWKTGLFEKGPWLLMVTGAWPLLLLIAPSIMAGESIDLFNPLLMIFIVIFGIGFILFFANEEKIEIVEMPAYLFTNMVSYTRLYAIGLSSAGMAVAFNTIALGGTIPIALGVVVLLGGHTLNVFVGLLGSTLHSLRLQYVEFFAKVYNGGGKFFRAFGKTSRYIE